MCGFSGIINRNNHPVPERMIKEMNDLINHRGPDDEGIYLDTNFALGHRRLSIIDLSQDGHQPMAYLNKYVITYNGEIYNYLEIKNDLQKLGYKFRSHTDTEVILAAYDKWGTECVKMFNGMWAFALHDNTKNIIFCSRDRFGIKPFYYTEVNNKFIFGSEIKQLLIFFSKRTVNQKILLDYLLTSYSEHTNGTFFENIFKLEQSHNLIYDLNTHQYVKNQYYEIQINKNYSNLTMGDSIDLYRKELDNAIRLRLRSDVKVGTCLSGGLDSSSIAAIASQVHQTKSTNLFTAITAKSIEKKTDETHFAEMVAKKSNLDWHITEPKLTDFLNVIDDVVYSQEEPFEGPSILMQYLVMKKAKELGCKVMLDGQGGDETLLGYERYYPAYFMSLDVKDRVGAFLKAAENSKLTRIQMLLYWFYFTSPYFRLKKLNLRSSYIKKEYRSQINEPLIRMVSSSYRDLFEMQKLELTKVQLPHLLNYEDKNAMRHSIETRLPFVDYRLVEVALSLGNQLKINRGWTKYVLRKGVENILHHDVVWRKNKFGFEAPIHIWNACQDDFIHQIKKSKILSNIMKSQDFSFNIKELWKLFIISKWEEIYNVSFD
jgi:asparagine synthase (glutamine-hydrolysing)